MPLAATVDISLTLVALMAIGVGVGMHDIGAALVVVGSIVIGLVCVSRYKLKGPK